MQPILDDQTFMVEIERIGPAEMQKKYGGSQRSIYSRRKRLEKRYATTLHSPRAVIMAERQVRKSHRVNLDILNGVVLVGSDAHIWPGPLTTAMKAFIRFAKDMNPRAVVLNGDVMDFPQISRHDPIGWEEQPSVADELAAAQAVLKQIEDAVSGNCKLAWTAGNHDMRLETRISSQAPELARLKGVHLKDHFGERWQPCWSVFINDDVVCKHRWKNGAHATHNNAVGSGKTMITGHLHSQKVTPYTDYNGTRYGVDTGCLADTDHQAFVNYLEDAPTNWRSGFAVLTFVDGVLLYPELVSVFRKDVVQFRGELINLCDRSAVSKSAKTVRGTDTKRRAIQSRAISTKAPSRPASASKTSRKR